MNFEALNSVDRIVNLGRLIWSFMTEEEQDIFIRSDGSLGFVEHVICIICPDFNFENTDLVEHIHDEIFQ